MIPGNVCLVAAMTASTLNPISWPPSPGLAPWATLICNSSAFTRYSAVTPNLPDATCFTADLRFLPSGCTLNLTGSSPPSPVLLWESILFIASARHSCDSLLMAPKDIAPATNLLMMDSADSTSSNGTGVPSLTSSRSRMKKFPLSSISAKRWYSSALSSRTAAWRALMDSGVQQCLSPSFL